MKRYETLHKLWLSTHPEVSYWFNKWITAYGGIELGGNFMNAWGIGIFVGSKIWKVRFIEAHTILYREDKEWGEKPAF